MMNKDVYKCRNGPLLCGSNVPIKGLNWRKELKIICQKRFEGSVNKGHQESAILVQVVHGRPKTVSRTLHNMEHAADLVSSHDNGASNWQMVVVFTIWRPKTSISSYIFNDFITTRQGRHSVTDSGYARNCITRWYRRYTSQHLSYHRLLRHWQHTIKYTQYIYKNT